MARKFRKRSAIDLAICLILLGSVCAWARDSEEQLLHRIQTEQNPVKKAKEEIKLADLQFMQVHDAYTHGQIEAGAKVLGKFMDTLKDAKKALDGSGRKASKQPEGFRELEISLREHERLLQDLGQRVSYFDRAPLINAAQELEQIRLGVLHALFPDNGSRPPKTPPPPAGVAAPNTKEPM